MSYVAAIVALGLAMAWLAIASYFFGLIDKYFDRTTRNIWVPVLVVWGFWFFTAAGIVATVFKWSKICD